MIIDMLEIIFPKLKIIHGDIGNCWRINIQLFKFGFYQIQVFHISLCKTGINKRELLPLCIGRGQIINMNDGPLHAISMEGWLWQDIKSN